MRIIAGEWRGRPLVTPEGQGTRPTSDRAREGLFSMLASRVGSFQGLHVADLFAGTGALGLEALSRGAAHCTFIENDRNAASVIQRSIDNLAAKERTTLVTQSVEYVSAPPRPFDIVFMDPPYRTGLAEMALARIGNPGWVGPGGWLSIETSGEKIEVPVGFSLDTERRFGKAHIFLLRR